MKMKAIAALVVVGVAAVAGGYVALNRYAGARVEDEVGAVFTALRVAGAQATHGAVSAESARRAVTIADVAVTSADGASRLTIGKVAVSGLGLPKDGRVSADSVDLETVEVAFRGPDGGTAVVALPQVRVEGYAGPLAFALAGTGPSAGVAPQAGSQPAASQDAAFVRPLAIALREFSRLTAAKTAAPQLTVRLSPGADLPNAEITYTNLAAEDLNGGRIRSLTADTIAFSVSTPDAGTPVSGDIRGVVVSDLDLAPLVMLADPGAAVVTGKDTPFQQVYERLVTGPYRVKHPDGVNSANSVVVEQPALRPSGLTLADLARLKILAAAVEAGEEDDAPELLLLTARLLDGFAVRSVAVSGMAAEDTTGKGRVAMTRLENLAAGKLERLAFAGLEGTDPAGRPARIGSFVLDRLDVSRLLILAADEGLPAPRELFAVLQGFELKDAELPFEGEGSADARPIRVGALAFSWGEMLGELPTRLSLRLDNASGPINAGDGEPFTYLANAGMTSATLSLALDVAYDANAAELTVKPARMLVDKAFSVTLSGGLGNVPPVAFENEEAAAAAFGEVTARPVSLSVTNLGLAELMLSQLAEAAGTTPEQLRADLVAHVDEMTPLLSLFSPDIPEVAGAVKRFIAEPGTLTLTATPKDSQPLLPLLSADGPFALLQAFSIKAETTR